MQLKRTVSRLIRDEMGRREEGEGKKKNAVQILPLLGSHMYTVCTIARERKKVLTHNYKYRIIYNEMRVMSVYKRE